MRIEPILQRQARAGARPSPRGRLPLDPDTLRMAQEISATLDMATRHLMLLWCAAGDDEVAAGFIAHALVSAHAGRRLAVSLIDAPDPLRLAGGVDASPAKTCDGRWASEDVSRKSVEQSDASRNLCEMPAVRGGC